MARKRLNKGLRRARCVRKYLATHGKALHAKARKACKVTGARKSRKSRRKSRR